MKCLNTIFRLPVGLPVVLLLSLIIGTQTKPILCSHNTSKYFPLLERPAEYLKQEKSHLSPSFFIAKASTAFKRGGGNVGIPELYGFYDLRDVIYSLQTVKGPNFINPIQLERGPNDVWIDESFRYKINSKINTCGFVLNYKQNVKRIKGFSFGLSIPVMNVNTSINFAFLAEECGYFFQNLRPGELEQLDRIRRKVHEELCLNCGNWSKTGFGDLDLYLSQNFNWDHKFLIKTIDLNFKAGFTTPTGMKSDIAYPSSVSFMSDGHWSVYFDIASELELKQDWKVGLILGAMHQFNNTGKFRIPVYQEPALFSALIADLKVDKGETYKVSPYLTIENLTDGINFQARYTYLRHSADRWIDSRQDKSPKSYLNMCPNTEIWDGKTVNTTQISQNIEEKRNQTRWRAHYVSLEINYNSKESGNSWVLDPIIYLTYDYQFNGNGSCKTHQFTLGMQLNF